MTLEFPEIWMTEKPQLHMFKKLPWRGKFSTVSLPAPSLLYTMYPKDPCFPSSICCHNDQWNEKNCPWVLFYYCNIICLKMNSFLEWFPFSWSLPKPVFSWWFEFPSNESNTSRLQGRKALIPTPTPPVCPFLYTNDYKLLTGSLFCFPPILLPLLTSRVTFTFFIDSLWTPSFGMSAFIPTILWTILPPNNLLASMRWNHIWTHLVGVSLRPFLWMLTFSLMAISYAPNSPSFSGHWPPAFHSLFILSLVPLCAHGKGF